MCFRLPNRGPACSGLAAHRDRPSVHSARPLPYWPERGRTLWRMLRDLRRLRVHWHDLQVFQVDERVVAENDERRYARHIADLLIAPAMLSAAQFHAMPVERGNLEAGAEEYARLLSEHGGTPPVLDVVQLGIGADGHRPRSCRATGSGSAQSRCRNQRRLPGSGRG